MTLTTMLVVVLAAMTSYVTAWTKCGRFECYDGDHWDSEWKGLKVAQCLSVSTLTSVPASLPADIQGLYIFGCSTALLTEDQFKSYRHLEKILIRKNKISQIIQGAFRYTTNVTYIDLSENAITELPSDFLIYTPNITKVSLYHNKIKRLQTNLFYNLKYLKTVVLRNNEITTIEDYCFNNVPQLEGIHLDNNKLISLDVNFIDNVKSLKELRLHNNNLTAIRTHQFANLSLITEIDVSHNNIELIEENSFFNLPSLEKIKLNENKLKQLSVNFIDEPSKLKIVSLLLRINKLTALKTHQFANLPLVTEIDVSYNNIELIEENSFFNLPSLETIKLNGNKLKHLSVNFMDEPSKLKAVLLHGNPWRCDESLCRIMDTVVKHAFWDAETVPKCAAPAVLRGKDWNRISDAFQLKMISSTTSVVEGHDLELDCRHCFPSRLVWTFHDFKLPSNFVKVSSESLTSKLIVKNIRKEQQGYYLCRIRSCEDCEDAGLYVSVSGKTASDFDVKQVLHVPGVNSSESRSSRSGLVLLPYTVAPTIELNTTHSN